MTLLALTHAPSPRMADCVRTYALSQGSETVIDLGRVHAQHEAYRAALALAGAEVHVLDVNRDHPDAVFIEDTAVVLDEIAVITSMGAPSRVGEPAGIEPVLARYRSIVRIVSPAKLEGGDVLRVGKQLLVGVTARTNATGISALTSITRPYGYSVTPVPIEGCLHLKSACTALPDGSLLLNERWLAPDAHDALAGFEKVLVPHDEPNAANVVIVGDDVIMSADCPRTAALVQQHAARVHRLDLSELAKADGSATCLSLIFALS